MSDTPRTEAIEDQYFENSIQGDEIFVHARKLERELAEAKAEIVRLKGEAQYGATFVQRAIDAERELAEAKAQRDKAIAFLHVYRNDTPLGNQPHMLAHEVDQFLKECGK
jgi:hypothetical protein